jgi:hypothetical protein
MRSKFNLIAATLLISAPAFAQQATEQQTPNFILGHGFLQPVPPSSDYPPGHTMANVQASPRPGSQSDRAAQSRNETDGAAKPASSR